MRLTHLAPLALCSLGLAACGGGDGGGDTLSKAELAKQANAICRQASKDLDTLAKDGGNTTDAKVAATFFDKATKLAEKQTADLEKLKPASDVKADYQTLLTELRKGTKILEDLGAAAKAKDATKGQALLTQVDAVDKAVNAAAVKVGATACGSSSS